MISFGAVIPAMDLTQVFPSGAGAIVNEKEPEVPLAFATVTLALPAVARSLEGRLAVRAVALLQSVAINILVPTQVVGKAVPFHCIATPS
jgi:hypothetical protein